MTAKYQVYGGTKYHSEHPGLVSACAVARSEAQRLGINFDVERDGVKVATYRTERGKFVAWMR